MEKPLAQGPAGTLLLHPPAPALPRGHCHVGVSGSRLYLTLSGEVAKLGAGGKPLPELQQPHRHHQLWGQWQSCGGARRAALPL